MARGAKAGNGGMLQWLGLAFIIILVDRSPRC